MGGMARKLRIAFSAGCGIVCVLLIALWVQSQQKWSQVYFQPSWGFFVAMSYRGQLLLSASIRQETIKQENLPPGTKVSRWGIKSKRVDWNFIWHPVTPPKSGFAVSLATIPGNYVVCLPTWFSVVTCMAVATLPWILRRFSLRTLLIATTLLAILLGTIVYAVR
jgi:hypothetical protein